jgi:hypothetical protein
MADLVTYTKRRRCSAGIRGGPAMDRNPLNSLYLPCSTGREGSHQTARTATRTPIRPVSAKGSGRIAKTAAGSGSLRQVAHPMSSQRGLILFTVYHLRNSRSERISAKLPQAIIEPW